MRKLRLCEVKWLCPRIQSWGVAARALGIQALFSRAFPLFFTRLPYLEHQNALLWILKWAHHVPTPIPLGSHSGCTLSDGWRLGFPQVTNSPNPLQLGRGGGGLFHGRVLPTSTWYHDDLGHHRHSRCPKIQIQGHIYTSSLKITFLILVASFVSSNFLSQANTFFFLFPRTMEYVLFFLSYTLCNSRPWSCSHSISLPFPWFLEIETSIYGTLGQNRLLNSVEQKTFK